MKKTLAELSVNDVLRWQQKHEKLTSEGAKVAHIRQLLIQQHKLTLHEDRDFMNAINDDWLKHLEEDFGKYEIFDAIHVNIDNYIERNYK